MTLLTEQFTIPKRWSFQTPITVNIACDPAAPYSVKLGLAVKAAYSADAVLRDAVLRGAVLRGAVLRGEKIARRIACADRSDGYTFHAFELQSGGVKIAAGCRWYTLAEYRAHILREYPDTDKARETGRILDLIEGHMSDLGIVAAEAAR